jgi:SAM-dependent methyltransferase
MGFSLPISSRNIYNLFADGELDDHERQMRAALATDLVLKREGKLDRPEAKQLLSLPWWQRIYDDRLEITTLSDHRLDDVAGPLHTLYGRLTEREAALLRPMAKWLYTKKHLPDLRSKSVLEIGSSSGFWSLKFAEFGAAKVTGVEAIPEQVECATFMAKRKGVNDRVTFINADAFYDRIEPHDIVFYSEVLTHSLVPHHAFLRTLGLAKELVIADEWFGWDAETNGQFFVNADLVFTGYAISENAALTLCYFAGIDLTKVRRYRNQYNRGCTLMIIPTQGNDEYRAERLPHPSMRAMITHAMGLGSAQARY